MSTIARLRQDELLSYVDEKSLATPCYVYDLKALEDRLARLKKAMPKRTKAYFAMKCNNIPEVLVPIAKAGFGVDLVSGGEWLRARDHGFQAQDVIFSGVGKTVAEIDEAILLRLGQLNVESLPELTRIIQRARNANMSAHISLRLNLGIATNTHPHISTGNSEHKFGLPVSQLPEASAMIAAASQHVTWRGLSAHVGSQIAELETFENVLNELLKLTLDLKTLGHSLTHLDCGGGWAVDYRSDQDGFPLEAWMDKVAKAAESHPSLEFQFEPGRWIVAPIGGLLARVEYVKRTPHRNFLIVNTGMHHLLRPALYQAYHRMSHLKGVKGEGSQSWTLSDSEFSIEFSSEFSKAERFDVVGPICETTDVLGKDRWFHRPQEGDWILIQDAGAYGEVMASHYNLQVPVHRLTFR